MAHTFRITERVQFSDTDMAGIMHFSNFFRFMERVEHAFCRSLGCSVFPQGEDATNQVGWPRVDASCSYRLPLRFEDEVEIELLVAELGSKTIKYLFRFWNADKELAAEGGITIICVRHDPETGRMKARDLPDFITELLDEAPPELLASPPSGS